MSLPAQAQLSHDKGDVTAHISVSHFVIPVPKLTVASSWDTQQSSYAFQTSPTLQASSECIYNTIYFCWSQTTLGLPEFLTSDTREVWNQNESL